MKSLPIIILCFSVLFSCDKKTEETTTEAPPAAANQITLTAEQKKNAGIETTTLQTMSLSNKTVLSGAIDVPPQSMASVSAPLGGIVKSAKFLPGNFVKRGQVLATIENSEIVQMQQDYLQAKTSAAHASKNAERQNYLSRYQAVSAKQAQQAQTEAKNQQIAVQALAARLSAYGLSAKGLSGGNISNSLVVRAPISGYISKINVNVGQYAEPAQPLFDIINNGDLHLALKVFEKDLPKISVGQRIFVYTNENPEKKYQASIILISKDFAADRIVQVHAHFTDPDPALLPGTFMNAEVEGETQQGYSVPDDAVVTWEGRQYIFEEVAANTYKMFPVSIGNSENGWTQVLNIDERSSHKKFVTKGAYQLLMALKNVEE